jgi:excisionase family DNA binding protein
MRLRQAAKALGVSERLLWAWTDRGEVPHVRLGKAVLYPVDSLREWLKRSAKTAGRQDDNLSKNAE